MNPGNPGTVSENSGLREQTITSNMSKPKFIMVEEPETPKKDQKTPPFSVTPALSGLKQMMLNAKRGAGGRMRLNNLRTKLAIGGSNSSASGSALTTVINVRPAAVSEFASAQALYDEFKVHGGVLHFFIFTTGQTNLVVGDEGAVAYDPVDNATYASVAGVLVASEHIGPLNISGVTDASLTSTAARTCAPVPHTKTGFWQLKFRCPPGSQQVANNSQQVQTGNWCATNITSSQGDYGYLKPYFGGAGSTTTTMYWYLVMDVEFRQRT